MATISSIRTKLLSQFPEPQATLMATVFVESHDELIHRAEFNELTAVVKELATAQHELAEAQQRTESRVEDLTEAQTRTESHVEELAEAQKRTEARVEELAEAQKRTESRVEELAEAQKRTEARVEELAEAQKRTESHVEELAEAQKRTEARVEELAEAQMQTTWAVKDLAKQVGGLAGALGGSLEDFACDLVPELLEHHQGMVIASAGPEEIAVAGKPMEFDVVIRGSIDSRPVLILCEVKAAVSASEVRRFLKVVERVRESTPGAEIRAMFFGFRADSQARRAIVSAGAAMVFTRGVMIP